MQQTGIFAGRTEVRCPYARWGLDPRRGQGLARRA